MTPEIEKVLNGESTGAIVRGDGIEVMRRLPEGSVDLVFGSPPY